jgi:hypothetical protein
LAYGQPLQQYSVCGNIPSRALTIPSYKFVIKDKAEKVLENAKVTGELVTAEHKWGHSYGDWNWEQTLHISPIPLTYDQQEHVWISAEVPKLKVEFRKGLRRPNCLDRIERFKFDFSWRDPADASKAVYSASFIFHFENRRLDQFSLPDNSKPMDVVLVYRNGNSY